MANEIDFTKWPSNPKADQVEPRPMWRTVPPIVWRECDIYKFSQVAPESLAELIEMAPLLGVPPGTIMTLRRLCSGESVEDICGNERPAVLMARVPSISERAMEIERYRSAIPVELCIQELLKTAITGHCVNGPVKPRDQIDALKYLISNVLPAPKSVDRDAIAIALDRVVRQKQTRANPSVIKTLTREQLEDELAKMKEEEGDDEVTPI